MVHDLQAQCLSQGSLQGNASFSTVRHRSGCRGNMQVSIQSSPIVYVNMHMPSLLCLSLCTHLIEQLIGDDKVVSERLLFQLIEVVHKDLLQLVQEQEH